MTLNKVNYLDLESVENIGTIHRKVLILSWCHLFEVDQYKIEMIVAKLNDTFNEQIPWLQHNAAVFYQSIPCILCQTMLRRKVKNCNLNLLAYKPNNLINQETKDSTCVNCKVNVSYLHNITAFQTQLGYGIKFRI